MPKSNVQFDQLRYCSILFEDEPLATLVTKVTATSNKGQVVEYSISEGNENGLFDIHKTTGEIFLAAYLDRETNNRHELIIAAEAGSFPAQTQVQITVADVNDNAPVSIKKKTEFVLVEEDDRDLPSIIGKVEVEDKDWIDKGGFLYTIAGDGIDGYATNDAYFSINSTTGEIIQLRPLDRDSPNGKPVWTLKVRVHDGQAKWSDISDLKITLALKTSLSKTQRKREINQFRHGDNFAPKMTKWTSDIPSEMHLFYESKMSSESDGLSFEGDINEKTNLLHRRKPFPYITQVRKTRPNKLSSTNYITKRSVNSFLLGSEGERQTRFCKRVGEDCLNMKIYDRGNITAILYNLRYFVSNRKKTNHVVQTSLFNGNKSARKISRNFEKHSSYNNISSHRLNGQRKSLRLSRDIRKPNQSTKVTSSGVPNYFITSKSLVSNFDENNCIRFDYLNPTFDADNEAQLIYLSSEGMLRRARGQIHITDIDVSIVVKDVNDNAPRFLENPIYGQAQENGPVELPVVEVVAYDADDIESGTNALLTYSIEKNVVDDETGEPLFTIGVNDGWLKTAVCCLDRETTPEYHLQVVASDGGGLKGTGTVVVRLSDLNDNPPRLSRREWDISIDETDKDAPPDRTSILQITADDPDTSNYFLFRIIPGSGNGWRKFGLRTKGNVGEVYVASLLDYEDQKQSRGLRFLVEVTDRGPGGWDDRRHVASAWVSVTLRDINDNSPKFYRDFANVTINEDARVGTLLETLSAGDPDEGENGDVSYRLVDPSDSLTIDNVGAIRIRSPLDREGPIGSNGTILVIAIDEGEPQRSSTATLYVNIEDVNDCPPRLLPPTVIHVLENRPPEIIGELIATDDDVWAKGHGPPFIIKMSPFNSDFVKNRINFRFNQDMNDGNGGAVVLTGVPLDREECRKMTLKVLVSDAGGLTSTSNVDIIVDDVNDNPMKPGSKTVFLWKTHGTSTKAPLGRVYVEDSDDWDGADKTYHWANSPHPLFALDKKSGNIFAMGQVREGRYELQFVVSDSFWGQTNISATVSIVVRVIPPEALNHAVPLTIYPATATSLTQDWVPTDGGGKLGLLVTLVEKHLSSLVSEIRIVSVYDVPVSSLFERNQSENDNISVHYSSAHNPGKNPLKFNLSLEKNEHPLYNIKEENMYKQSSWQYNTNKNNNFGSSYPTSLPSVSVWISAKDTSGAYINVVKFGGFLELNLQQMEEKLNLTLEIGSFQELNKLLTTDSEINQDFNIQTTETPSESSNIGHPIPTDLTKGTADPSVAVSLASVSLPLQVVDNNRTALVTPRLTSSRRCISPLPTSALSTLTCSQVSCLNGGRCIPTEKGPRCVCPGNTIGPFCLIVSRSFSMKSYIWLKPLNSCLPMQISLRFLTRYPDGILVYSGPLTSSRKNNLNTDNIPSTLVLQISNGRPQLILRSSRISLQLQIENAVSVNDEKWHDIHVQITNEGVSLMLDFCASGTANANKKFDNCIKYQPFTKSLTREFWVSASPLQVGGLARSLATYDEKDSFFKIVDQSLRGCISELRLSNELIDFGEPKYSYNSYPGCLMQNKACRTHCSGKQFCTGGLGTKAFCSCPQGWTGTSCKQITEMVSMADNAFIKLALSFTPDPLRLTFSLRLRTNVNHRLIFKLTSQNKFSSLTLKVTDGTPCLFYQTRYPTEKKPSPVSIVGITSTSSVKALNLSSTFYIKNWNQFNSGDKNKSSEMLTSNKLGLFADSKNDMKISTISSCLTGTMISDGSWYEVSGERFGYNLFLQVKNENILIRNETLGMYKYYKGLIGKKHKKKLDKKNPPDDFIVDRRDGLIIGDFVELQQILVKEESQNNLTMCIDDFRISGRQLPLPPNMNGSKWAQMSAFSGVQSGCLVKKQCKPNTCPPNLKCKERLGSTSCECPPKHRFSQDGCKPFDVCQFNPCLNDGFCKPHDRGGFICTCLARYEGEHCQWTVNNSSSGGIFAHLLLGSFVTFSIFLVVMMVLLCRRLKQRKRRRKKSGKRQDKSFDSDTEKGNSEYISIELRNTSSEGSFDDRKRSQKRKENADISEYGDTSSNHQHNAIDISKLGVHDGLFNVEDSFAVQVPRDDVRAYAYGGERSSNGSLESLISDLRRNIFRNEDEEPKNIPPVFGEVVELFQNLPHASLHFSQSEKHSDPLKHIPALQTTNAKAGSDDTKNTKNLFVKSYNKAHKFSPNASASESVSEPNSSYHLNENSKHSFVESLPSSSLLFPHNKLDQPILDVSIISENTEKTKCSSFFAARTFPTEVQGREDIDLSEEKTQIQSINTSSRKKMSLDSLDNLKELTSNELNANVMPHMSLHV